ncbi:MAG TPA: VOC family protein [Micromonosporaceae bacterium]|jgi:catechol 2,3-dioxygenase-like lactoylglutathione lyase family enzyme
MSNSLAPSQLNLVVRDLSRSIDFYRLLGWPVGEPAGSHVAIDFGEGLTVELDQYDFARQWNSGTPMLNGGSAVLSVTVAERPDVDALVDRMAGAGYVVRQVAYDTFWGSRFAVIADPDGYQIGIMSPSVAEHRFWPPSDAPTT